MIRVLVLIGLLLSISRPGFAADNLLLNGDLTRGTGKVPEHWTRTPFAPPGSFNWSHAQGEPATLEAATVGGNFRHPPFWRQKLELARTGWYRLRAEVRTEDPEALAAFKVEGPYATAIATQSSQQWTPMEVYFKATEGPLQIGCGVRAMPAGRALFRNLTLVEISGVPPPGSIQLDVTHEALLSTAEKKALLGVDLAKSPPSESLWRELLSLRVIALLAFLLVSLTYLDWRYRDISDQDSPKSIIHDPAICKSALVATLLCLALLGTWLVGRLEYLPGHGFFVVEPHAVAGDEPHYLVMINSLLLRHDLHLEAAYDHIEQGGFEGGVLARGGEIDRHTIVVNRRTGNRAMANVRNGQWFRNPAQEFARSPAVYEIPVHPYGFPLLMALAVAPLRPDARQVEPVVGRVLMLIGWLGVVATYFVGRQAGMSSGWAMAAVLILFGASPWLPYSRAYFAECTIGTVLILSLWAMLSDRPILAAIAVVMSAIMKPPFGVVGIGFLTEEFREKRWKGSISLILILGLCAVGFFFRDYWAHRRFLPFSQLFATLLDPVEGLLLYAPWVVFAFFTCGRALLPNAQDSRLVRTMTIPLLLYLVGVSSVGHGSGYSYGPRYWIAFMPWLALGTVEAMRRAGRYQRSICALLVLCGVALAIPGALRYPQLFRASALDAWRGFH